MFLILAKEKIQHLKDRLFVWNRAFIFPNRQQAVKKISTHIKKNEIEDKITE